MNKDLLQATVDIVFSGYMLYLSVPLFLLLVVLFSDSIIGLLYSSIKESTTGRRTRY